MSRARERADGNAPTGSVEGTDIAFLENSSGQDLVGGTYSTERMYLAGRTGSAPNDYNYKLTGNVTVTGHLALGSIADSDVVITQDSTERTITGSGLLESGRLMNDPTTSLTGMTGELGSAVTGSPNLNLGNATHLSGSVRQVKVHSFVNYGATATDFNIPNTTGVGFDNPMSNSSNNVVLFFSVNSESYDTSTTSHWYGYWNGGSFPSLATSSSNRFADAVHYGHDGSSIRCQVGATEIDTNPGSLNPLYSIHINLGSSLTAAFVQPRLVLMELHP